jgi:N-terminal domain of anti-restriction factor ArdC
MNRDLYATVSARIVAELERGAAPWIKPWSAMPGASTPCNAVSNRPYSGCNVVLLWMAQAANCRHSSAKPPCGSTTKQLYCSSLDGRFIRRVILELGAAGLMGRSVVKKSSGRPAVQAPFAA